jgi:glycosyltransferase involved in cell wall biosynthesis
MRVLIFPGFLETTWSSIEERYLWLDAPLRQEGACFWLVPRGQGTQPRYVAELAKIGANLIACDLRPARFLHNLRQVGKVLKEHEIDVVYTHFGPLRFHVEAAAKLAGVRVARGEHNFAFHRDRRFKFAKRLFWRWSTDFFIPVSHAVAMHLTEAGVMRENGMVVHDGFDLAGYPDPSPETSREQLLQALGLDRGTRLLACVAKIHPAKQQHLLVDMMAELGDLPAALLLVGAAADPDYLAGLKARAAELGLERRIVFTGYRTDVPRVLDAVDISYLPSLVEGLGNVVVESYLMGTPAIASDLPAIREIVDDGRDGYLVPLGLHGEYARHTRRLLGDDRLRHDMGAAGKARISRKFSRTLFEENSVEALRRAARLPKRPSAGSASSDHENQGNR